MGELCTEVVDTVFVDLEKEESLGLLGQAIDSTIL